MKKHKKNMPAMHRTWPYLKHIMLCGLLALIAPLVLKAQQTVFYDTFDTSTLDQTNIPGGIPGGSASDVTPFSATSYTVGSAKNALGTTITTNSLKLISSKTSSGNSEIQAIFTRYPIKLESVGDYIELTYTFTDLDPIYTDPTYDGALFMGLFNSGGVAPHSGPVIQNGYYGSAPDQYTDGGVKGWTGYNCDMYNKRNWDISARPPQTTDGNTYVQALLYNYPNGLSYHALSTPGSPGATPNTPYTFQLRITLSATGTFTISNALYVGVGTGGTQFTNNVWSGVTGANFTTNSFDALAIGFRAANPAAWTNDIKSIKVVASLAAQAGPYYFVTSGGDPCSGGISVGLSGSVTTNNYLLYLNNVYAGTTLTGTGAALDFGAQSAPGTYTVIASNTVTASVGPMYGSANVYAPGVTINTQPASATVVSNLPASFSVTATGASLSYQWYKNGVALTNNSNISGAQTATLNLAAAQAADAATTSDGYTVVVQTPCGNVATSAPPAALTLAAPRNLIWAGGNPGNTWNFSDANFALSGNPATFAEGDDATFNDSSSYTSVTVSNDVTPTLITVAGTKTYNFGGPAKITGVSQLMDSSSGTLTIANDNNYTGGTIVTNGATLSLGDGTSFHGSVEGTVTISPTGTLQYYYSGPGNGTITLKNALAGGGTVNYNDANGSILATPPTGVSSNFNGIINVQGYTALHASDGNAGYALGNGSTVNVPSGTQVWLDRSASSYNNTFNISGTGWLGASPQTGAMRVFNCTINGPINLLDNARIGGSINGATIQSVISGNYQLEVWGNAGSFVLNMGPTNGLPQAYASTLITSGSISAANGNAISSGSLTLDVAGDMRLNGNNVTVASLSSINSGQVTSTTGSTVQNTSASTPATLIVGTDNSSSEFDGTFLDGGAASLGLTKVGTGTLTLTGINTNTGAITVKGGTLALFGSSSFGKAAVIAPVSGGTYDVSGAGGALTLNSGQTLSGNGTVNGTVVAPAGSKVAPGFPMGTLTVSGNCTVSGIYQVNLNRTNSPVNCSQLTSSGGSVSYSAATLVATNIGPKLQAGDFFQLFPGATTGFAAYNLQTSDPANNVVYAWNNTVSSDGRITVASVTTLVNTNPPQVQVSVSGNTLSLAWPTNAGWTLLTNSVGLTAANQWFPYPNSASLTNVDISMDPTKTNVFFRMAYPYP